MSLVSLALRLAAPAPQVEAFDRYLFLGPHPDDIEIGAGATAAKLIAAGKQVCFLICTDGRFGLEHAPTGTAPEDLIALRQAEALSSAKGTCWPPRPGSWGISSPRSSSPRTRM